jgi:tetratricopeptide (TPR) repeat protein
MAKEPFFKINFRKSSAKIGAEWDSYTKTYGNWMANAFPNQKKVKEQFISALDSLHKNYPKDAVQILDSELKSSCQTDEEKTVWLFFMGLAHKAMEQYAKALLYFTSASEYETKSPVIYQNLADCAYKENLFGFAESNYLEAIPLYEKEKNKEISILAALYANLASCYIMMHDNQSAEEMLARAEKADQQTAEVQKARTLLYAVSGEHEKATVSLKNLLKMKGVREDLELTRQMDDIRSGTSAQFSTIFVENFDIKSFWRWFSTRLEAYLSILDSDQTDEISKMTLEISLRLKKLFPFVPFDITVSAYKNQNYSIFISDFYAQALSDGLDALFAAMPEKIKDKIYWIKIH